MVRSFVLLLKFFIGFTMSQSKDRGSTDKDKSVVDEKDGSSLHNKGYAEVI